VIAAASRIAGAVRRTPLLSAPFPTESDLTPGVRGVSTDATDRIWLKCENLQRVSAFKARGAYHFVGRLTAEARAAGLLTYSSGNHAQAVAFAARAFDTNATIVMPIDAPRVKLEATLRLGAEVEQVGTTSSERRDRAEEIQRESGGTMVPPFDHPDIIAGQGTVGLEVIEQLRGAGADAASESVSPSPGLVLAPIGGGGLVSGVSAVIRGLVPGARVIGVEPEGAPSMMRSLEAGAPVTLDRVSTVADGLKPVRPGDLTYTHCRDLVERVVTVTDEQIRAAVVWLFRRRLVVEPSGAATVAALLSGVVEPAEQGATVAVLSGGNIEPALLADWITTRSGTPEGG
jgi:threonine dehydratase